MNDYPEWFKNCVTSKAVIVSEVKASIEKG